MGLRLGHTRGPQLRPLLTLTNRCRGEVLWSKWSSGSKCRRLSKKAPHPETTPSLVAHHQPSTSSPLLTHTRPCQRLLARAPCPRDLVSTSMPRTVSATSASPLSRLAQGQTPSGSYTSGSSATSSVTAAPQHHSTLRPQSTHLVHALHPLCLPPPQHLDPNDRPGVCRYHLHLQTSLHQGLHPAPAEPCRPHAGRTRRLNG